MSVLKDAVIVCCSVLATLAVRHLLQGYKLVDCQAKFCTSNTNNEAAGNDNSYRGGFLSWTTDEEAKEDSTRCLCCEMTRGGYLPCAFTALSIAHVVISLAVIFLKHKTFTSPHYIWIHITLIIVTVLNTLLITTLVRQDTYEYPDIEKEGLLWKMFAVPFRIVWRTLTSIVCLLFYRILISPFSVTDWVSYHHDSVRGPVVFLCSMDQESLTSLNGMRQHSLCALSWIYVVSAAANLYSLMNSLSKEEQAEYDNKGKGGQEKDCRLRREILASKRRIKVDDPDSEDSEDSFVLGWRL